MEAVIDQQDEWLSARQLAKRIGSDPRDVSERIRRGLVPGGQMIPSLTGNKILYKIHYPTFIAGNKETTNEV